MSDMSQQKINRITALHLRIQFYYIPRGNRGVILAILFGNVKLKYPMNPLKYILTLLLCILTANIFGKLYVHPKLLKIL